jgi:hypothetical protein
VHSGVSREHSRSRRSICQSPHVSRRLRVRLISRPGSSFIAYGGFNIPDDGVIELSEADAAAFLHRRGAARNGEVLGWIEDEPQDDPPPVEA